MLIYYLICQFSPLLDPLRGLLRVGVLKRNFSDNWKTFTAAAKAFKAISENETVSRLIGLQD